jgi:acyl-coenzyme A synthetase/AMP-(fatty) acid ligase/acyl carrier protein
VQVRVVDPSGAAVPKGQPGELVVGGCGVARGYVTTVPEYPGRGPVVTPGERFFAAAGSRWYHTGDLVHQAPDGSLVYRGRADDQVKVRGHRVELAEVEQSLRRHPGVRACAVAAGGGRLVAYVVPGAPALSTAEVLAEAARWLPDFMLPQEVRVVDTLPLTGNGKLNRRALTAMSEAPDPPGLSEVLADTLTLVRQALEIEQVGPDDDVFEAGGHSLVAAQLAVAATERFGVPVAALQVYDHPTPARLAALISTLAPRGKAA